MAALGQPVIAAEPSPAYAPAFQQPYQGMYLDPYAAAQAYGAPQYIHAPVYPNYPDRAFPAEVPPASALQWEMPQVRKMNVWCHSLKRAYSKVSILGQAMHSVSLFRYCGYLPE